MLVNEIMTKDPATCNPDMNLVEVAKMMVDCDCGAVPVVDKQSGKPLGIITDRDITCRAVAKGLNPSEVSASECMTNSVYSISPDDDIEKAAEVMEKHRIRRLLVVEEDGMCCGILVQAQLVKALPKEKAGEFLQEISEKTMESHR